MLAQTHASRDVLQYVLWGIILLGFALMVALWVASPGFTAGAPEYGVAATCLTPPGRRAEAEP